MEDVFKIISTSRGFTRKPMVRFNNSFYKLDDIKGQKDYLKKVIQVIHFTSIMEKIDFTGLMKEVLEEVEGDYPEFQKKMRRDLS